MKMVSYVWGLRGLNILQLKKIYTSRKGFHTTDKILTVNKSNAVNQKNKL